MRREHVFQTGIGIGADGGRRRASGFAAQSPAPNIADVSALLTGGHAASQKAPGLGSGRLTCFALDCLVGKLSRGAPS